MDFPPPPDVPLTPLTVPVAVDNRSTIGRQSFNSAGTCPPDNVCDRQVRLAFVGSPGSPDPAAHGVGTVKDAIARRVASTRAASQVTSGSGSRNDDAMPASPSAGTDQSPCRVAPNGRAAVRRSA